MESNCPRHSWLRRKLKDFARSLMEGRGKPWVTWQGFIPRAQRVAYCQISLMHHVHACREGRRDLYHCNHTDSTRR